MRRIKFLFKAIPYKSCLKLFTACTAALCLLYVPAMADSVSGELLWHVSLGSDYRSAPSAPLVEGDAVYTMCGKRLYKLDRFTGDILAVSSEAEETAGYGIIPPTMGGGMIFVPLRKGMVQAFDAQTLKPLWCTEAVGGQAITPVCYNDGKIFFGTWLNETEIGYYCGYEADTSGCELLWRLEHKGGFYRAGALAKDGLVIFGSDDGADSGQAGSGTLYILNEDTGESVSVIDGFDGDIRSSVVEYDGGYVFSSKGGYIYYVKDGTVKSSDIGGECASTPAIDGHIAYAGTSNKEIVAVDLNTMEIVNRIKADGYPNGGVSVRGGRIYTTCNVNPGGVYSGAINSDSLQTVFTPGEGMRNYCISPISFGDDGTLYYKNDSGNIFAVRLTLEAEFVSPRDTEAWLITVRDKVTLEKIWLNEGANTVEALMDGGCMYVWTPMLEPLTKKLEL